MEIEARISHEPVSPVLRGWFAPVLRHGSLWCAPNLDAQCAFLQAGEREVPLSVNWQEWENSWVCSPYTHYVSYAREEIARALPSAVGASVAHVWSGLGAWFRSAQLNQVVMVNNWLMSTNPWPTGDGAWLGAAVAAMQQRWPEHALIFRSLNERESAPLLEALRRHGAHLIPSRQIWWYDPHSERVRRSRDVRKDVNLLQRGDLRRVEHEELREEDFPRLTSLYERLYVHKYSRHNPRYSTDWLRHLWTENHLRFTALRDESDQIVGVEACGLINGVMVSPIVGYDPGTPRSLGLYRRLAVLPILSAREKGVSLNLSAGVGRFKALRGGEPVMEFLGVIDSHLPVRRRLPWRFIEGLSRGLLEPVVRRLKL
ncbi:MAG: hypothetical protein DVB23_002347 [Verrucomicrobia bacterium]|nr:MAG: hypothetical protein DVB23_002347 [Verrucomicrobiota bacterium]